MAIGFASMFFAFLHRISFEFVGIMHESVEDGMGQRVHRSRFTPDLRYRSHPVMSNLGLRRFTLPESNR